MRLLLRGWRLVWRKIDGRLLLLDCQRRRADQKQKADQQPKTSHLTCLLRPFGRHFCSLHHFAAAAHNFVFIFFLFFVDLDSL